MSKLGVIDTIIDCIFWSLFTITLVFYVEDFVFKIIGTVCLCIIVTLGNIAAFHIRRLENDKC